MANKKKVGLDDGHGLKPYPTGGKRTPAIPELGGRVIYEDEFNSAVIKELGKVLERCGIEPFYTAPEDTDVPLGTRVRRANDAKCDILVSAHYNAHTSSFATSKGQGVEVLAGSSSESKKLSQCILNEVKQGTQQVNRGLKDGSWLYLNRCNMPLALVEYGFMDNKREAMLMLDDKFITECAEETARGICKYLGVTYKAGNQEEVKSEPKKETVQQVKAPAKSNDKAIGTVKVLVDDLVYYNKKDWNAKAGKTKKGDVFTVVEKIKVNTAYMYKLKSGTYITAATKYVKFTSK